MNYNYNKLCATSKHTTTKPTISVMGKNALRLHNVQFKTNVAAGCALKKSTQHKPFGLRLPLFLWWFGCLCVFANALRGIKAGMKLLLGIHRQAEMRTNL